jgi:hypothetical protein
MHLQLEALHKSRMEESEKPKEEKKDDGLRKRKGSKAVPGNTPQPVLSFWAH